MAGNMGSANGGQSGDPGQPLWSDLSADDRAEFINRDVEKIIQQSKVATKEIVDAAMKEFEADYAAIKSKAIRDSVLRNIIEVPLPVDPEGLDATDPKTGGPLLPPPPTRPTNQMTALRSFFLHLFGL